MRRIAAVGLALLGLATPCLAGKLDRAVESRWRGAWVLTKVAAQSDCSGLHTDNLVSGTLVSSKGRYQFRPGELAHVDKVDVHRSRVDLIMSLPEAILVGYQDGPFKLYNEIRCPLELDVEVPRDLVSNDDTNGIDSVLRQAVDRFSSQEEAQAAKSWNGRRRDPYPANYQQTLAEHQAWKAQQANAAIQTRLDRAAEEASRLTDRLTSDQDYLAGFASGVEAMKRVELADCGSIMSRDFANLGPTPQPARPAANGEAQQRWGRGYQDGLKLVFALESMRRLPGCFIQAPEAQASQRRPLN